MAELRATPMSNPIMGLLADRLKKVQQFGAKPFGYENPPVEMLMNLLGVPAVQQTMERMAYGEPLTTGSGMTTKPRAEAVEAAMAVAPVAGLLGKATKGLPVGASIKNVGEDLLSYRGSHKAPSPDFGAPLHDLTGGGQMYPADVYSAKAAQFYGTGYPKADKEAFDLAKKIRGNPNAEVTMYRAVPKDEKITKINEGDWVTLSKDYAKVHGESVLGDDYKIISQKVKAKELWTNADSIHEFGYHPQKSAPRQEALDTAQRNAALPVEEGGLGLPKDNTPEMRAKAMGFDVQAYRGITGDIDKSVIPSDFFGSNYFGKGINLTSSPTDASKYASTDVGINTDLVGKAELMSERLGISYPQAKADITSGGGAVLPISANIKNPLIVGMQKIQTPDSMIRYALNESGYSGNVDKLVDQFKNANTGFEQFELMKANQATPFYRNLASLMNKDGLMIDESISPKSDGAMHYIALEPEQLRSRFAAFDPMRRNEPDLLAGVLPLGLLSDEEQRKKLYELVPTLLGQ
jgi:hypothetical protein